MSGRGEGTKRVTGKCGDWRGQEINDRRGEEEKAKMEGRVGERQWRIQKF